MKTPIKSKVAFFMAKARTNSLASGKNPGKKTVSALFVNNFFKFLQR